MYMMESLFPVLCRIYPEVIPWYYASAWYVTEWYPWLFFHGTYVLWRKTEQLKGQADRAISGIFVKKINITTVKITQEGQDYSEEYGKQQRWPTPLNFEQGQPNQDAISVHKKLRDVKYKVIISSTRG